MEIEKNIEHSPIPPQPLKIFSEKDLTAELYYKLIVNMSIYQPN